MNNREKIIIMIIFIIIAVLSEMSGIVTIGQITTFIEYMFLIFLILLLCVDKDFRNEIFNGLKKQNFENAKTALSGVSKYMDKDRNLFNNRCRIILNKHDNSIMIKNIEPKLSSMPRKIYIVSNIDLSTFCEEICSYFNENTTQEDLINRLYENGFLMDIIDDCSEYKNNNANSEIPILNVANEIEEEKIDINNAVAEDIATLPGINIVCAKKVIKKREEIGGFKSIDEVMDFLNLKLHFYKKVIKLIKIEEMKINVIRLINNVRKIDI